MSVMSDFLQPYGLEPTSLVCPWDSPGKNIGVGFLALLQGIFLTQGSNPSLLHCRRILYCSTTREAQGYICRYIDRKVKVSHSVVSDS